MNVRLESLALCGLVACTTGWAAVPPQDAAKLGKTLTVWGAETAASANGAIPAFVDGKRPQASTYDAKTPWVRPDPFAAEKPLYTITADNLKQYGHLVSDGVKEMLRKYPATFRLDVYPTHRLQRYPKLFLDNTLKNAVACQASADGQTLEGCLPGMLFPIPKTGVEVMWNHAVRYTAPSQDGRFQSFSVDSSGGVTLQGDSQSLWQMPTFLPEHFSAPIVGNSVVRRVFIDTVAPARKNGEKMVFVDLVDAQKNPVRVWQYLPGQRRVKLAPDLAYDTPNPQSAGVAFMDESYGFMGALDRFNFKLIGKRDMVILSNPYKFADAKAFPLEKKLQKGHLNPEALRWELRRVWEVEATLKPGLRHAYKSRKFYFDEDSPGAGIGEGYDASGKVVRTCNSVYMPWYETADQGSVELNNCNDLQTGNYVVNADAAYTGGFGPSLKPAPASTFTGDALTGAGVR